MASVFKKFITPFTDALGLSGTTARDEIGRACGTKIDLDRQTIEDIRDSLGIARGDIDTGIADSTSTIQQGLQTGRADISGTSQQADQFLAESLQQSRDLNAPTANQLPGLVESLGGLGGADQFGGLVSSLLDPNSPFAQIFNFQNANRQNNANALGVGDSSFGQNQLLRIFGNDILGLAGDLTGTQLTAQTNAAGFAGDATGRIQDSITGTFRDRATNVANEGVNLAGLEADASGQIAENQFSGGVTKADLQNIFQQQITDVSTGIANASGNSILAGQAVTDRVNTARGDVLSGSNLGKNIMKLIGLGG